jgi:hypothetical protein
VAQDAVWGGGGGHIEHGNDRGFTDDRSEFLDNRVLVSIDQSLHGDSFANDTTQGEVNNRFAKRDELRLGSRTSEKL